MSATRPAEADRTVVEFPASAGYRSVGRLVVGGIASRFDLPIDRVDDLLLAIESVFLQEPAAETVRLVADATPDDLRVSLGPLRLAQPRTPRCNGCCPGSSTTSRPGGRRHRADRARRLGHVPAGAAMTRTGQEFDFVSLIEAYRAGDEQARDQLVERYMPLVRSLAARYAGRGEPQEDLVQVGSIGLLLSIERFDTERGVQFTTYAVPTIVGEIQRHFRDRAWALHVPRRMKELSVRLSRSVESLTVDLGRSPTIAELAETVGVEEDDVVEALQTSEAYSTRSLSQPLGHDGGDDETMQDLLGTSTRASARSRTLRWSRPASPRSTSASGESSSSASSRG